MHAPFDQCGLPAPRPCAIQCSMSRQRRIIVADRSELAANMYRLLLATVGAEIVVCRKFEEARPHFFRRERTDLGIFNSNIFGKKFDEIYGRIVNAHPMLHVPKIFICRDVSSEDVIRGKLSELEKSTIVVRPFHTQEFLHLVEALVEGRGE